MTRTEKNELASKEGYALPPTSRAHVALSLSRPSLLTARGATWRRYAFLLRGEAETRLCDYDAAMRTFQLGCKADARLGPEARKELRQAWYGTHRHRDSASTHPHLPCDLPGLKPTLAAFGRYAAKELCRGWRRAGRLKKAEARKRAFAGERRPVLHDIQKFTRPEDKALALRNLAMLHSCAIHTPSNHPPPAAPSACMPTPPISPRSRLSYSHFTEISPLLFPPVSPRSRFSYSHPFQ